MRADKEHVVQYRQAHAPERLFQGPLLRLSVRHLILPFLGVPAGAIQVEGAGDTVSWHIPHGSDVH
jgi:hypothetical protein